MPSAPLQIRGLQMQRAERHKICGPQRRELVEQVAERLPPAVTCPFEAVERLERPRLAMLEDHLQSRHPVRLLAVNQMTDDVDGAPRVRPFIRERPLVRKITQ